MNANDLKYSQDYVDAQQAEIERLREVIRLTYKTACGRDFEHLELPEAVAAARQADAAEIERLRVYVSGARCPHCDELRLELGHCIHIDNHNAIVANRNAEIERLRQQVTQLGARMQVMREWMMPNDWRHFVVTKPEAAEWFYEDGTPR